MSPRGYDKHKVVALVPKGQKLSPSRKVRGALSPLVHGKGISGQAILMPDKSGGWKRKALTLVAKVGFVAIAAGIIVVVATMIITAVSNGVAAGVTKVTGVVEDATVVAGGAVALLLVCGAAYGLVRIAARRRGAPKRRKTGHPAGAPRVGVDSSNHPSDWRQSLPSARDAHRPQPGVTTTSPIADWYPDPWKLASLRFWDGSTWTHYVHGEQDVTPTAQPSPRPQAATGDAAMSAEQRVSMTISEWQDYVLAWMKTGAMEQELWRRLSHAQIRDADQATLAAQNAMENLTLEEGQQRIKFVLEMAPTVHDGAAIAEFMQLLLGHTVRMRQQSTGSNSMDELRRPGRY